MDLTEVYAKIKYVTQSVGYAVKGMCQGIVGGKGMG